MKKQTKTKTEARPTTPSRKVARKSAPTSSAPKSVVSTTRKIRTEVEQSRAGQNSKPARPVIPAAPSKTDERATRSTTKPVKPTHLPPRTTRKAAAPELVEPSATSQDPIQFPEESKQKVKTYLTAKQLREFKTILLEKRAELAGDVERLTAEALKGKGQGYADQSTMPIHMADLGSDNWEQDFTIGLIANEQNLVREIDDALERIEDRTYGMCLATDKPISLARLQAKPWAKYCIEYERAREEGRAP